MDQEINLSDFRKVIFSYKNVRMVNNPTKM